MQLRNIRPFSQYQPGDTVSVPDGAAFDDFHWEAVAAVPEEEPPPAEPVTPAAAAAPRLPTLTPKEM